MSFSNWLHHVAVRGCLIAAVAVALPASAQEDNSQKQPGAAPPQAAQTQTTPNAPPIPDGEKAIEPDWSKPNCEKPKQHNEADLCEQIRMAKAAQETVFWNKVQVAIGLLTLIGLAFTVHYTRQTARAAIAAAKVAERALNDLERPFVYIETRQRGFDIMADGNLSESGPLIYDAINLGRTPADLWEVADSLQEIVKDDWPLPVVPGTGERVLPPGSVVAQGRPVQFRIHMSNFIGPVTRGRVGIDTNLFLIGYIRYADVFGQRYVTGFCAILDIVRYEFVLRGDERYNYTRKEI